MSRRTPKKHHLFLHWLKSNRLRFPFEPQILAVSRRSVRGQFIGVTSAIQFVLTQSGIVISAQWTGQCWDLISEFDVAERQTDQGYYNGLVLAEWITYYPTREALWRLESFEPFLTWCHKTLAISQFLALYEYTGATWTRLLKNEDNDKDCRNRLALIEISRPTWRQKLISCNVDPC